MLIFECSLVWFGLALPFGEGDQTLLSELALKMATNSNANINNNNNIIQSKSFIYSLLVGCGGGGALNAQSSNRLKSFWWSNTWIVEVRVEWSGARDRIDLVLECAGFVDNHTHTTTELGVSTRSLAVWTRTVHLCVGATSWRFRHWWWRQGNKLARNIC